jgi:hypothetical protein
MSLAKNEITMATEIYKSTNDLRQYKDTMRDYILDRGQALIVDIGYALQEMKTNLPWGEFNAWTERELGIDRRTATNYMAAYKLTLDQPYETSEMMFKQITLGGIYSLAQKKVPVELREEILEKAKDQRLNKPMIDNYISNYKITNTRESTKLGKPQEIMYPDWVTKGLVPLGGMDETKAYKKEIKFIENYCSDMKADIEEVVHSFAHDWPRTKIQYKNWNDPMEVLSRHFKNQKRWPISVTIDKINNRKKPPPEYVTCWACEGRGYVFNKNREQYADESTASADDWGDNYEQFKI